MDQHEDPGIAMGVPLESWPNLVPDPAAMANITALMMAGVAETHAQSAAAEPGESQFRLLSYIWAAVAVGTYLAWELLASWFQLHPIGLAILIGFAGVSLLAPLLLLPMLPMIEAPANDQGGTAVC